MNARSLMLSGALPMVLGATLPGSTPAAARGCVPLPPARQGIYRNTFVTGIDLRLTLGNCTYRFTDYTDRVGVVGDYTVTSGDATSGQLVLSNTPLCANPHEGAQDLPAPYSYTFAAYTLTLHIAQAQDPCGFRQTRIGQYPWIKAIKGRLIITYDATRGRGTFKATGAVADSGPVTIATNGAGTLKGANGTIRFRERLATGRPPTVTIVSGSGAYVGIHGVGTETRRTAPTRVHAVVIVNVAS